MQRRIHPIHARTLLTILLGISMAIAGLAPTKRPPADPFRIEGKPPTLGYFTTDDQPIDPSLIDVPMLAELTGVFGRIEPRRYTTLRRAIIRKPIDQTRLSPEHRLATMHLHRGKIHYAYALFDLDEKRIAIQSPADKDLLWGLSRVSLERIGVRLPKPKSVVKQELPDQSTSQGARFELSHPYIQSETVLDTKTIRARIKQNYPRLSRKPDDELYRVRLPKDFNPDFPAGVLVWISPMPDGRIPRIFEPICDKLGLIAIGVDSNGNKRSITDRLQNHLDSIETVADRYRIDRQRIYLTGMSGGGRCSSIMQMCFPELFAGAVPIVGLDTYHNAPTGDPGKYWPARFAKPAGRWMTMLKARRIAAITGTADFNEPEMVIRQELLERDGIDMRLDIIDGMAHTMPTSEQFSSALDWVDQPRRTVMVQDFKEAKKLLANFNKVHPTPDASDPAQRHALAEIITLAPWTEPAWDAAALLGYTRAD
jgi:predicted esterase